MRLAICNAINIRLGRKAGFLALTSMTTFQAEVIYLT